jgi:hypothetical protein
VPVDRGGRTGMCRRIDFRSRKSKDLRSSPKRTLPVPRSLAMAHKVTFDLPKRELGREDIVFVVHKNDKRFGTLLISKGAVEWRPTNKVYRRKISWDKFDQLMREIGNRV